MDTSPYLSAIQSLEGDTPGAKYKTLHSIATQIIGSNSEKDEFLRTGKSDRVNPALFPHLRILVGIKLQLSDAVIEALKSDDVTIVKLALNAKWFFNVSNQLINVENFTTNIIPYISLRTRLELIKRLANCLKDQPKKADEFFDKFCEQYGTDQSLPLIVACSEHFIYDQILKRKLQIPHRILTMIYRRYPELVIRYLQLGNDKNEKNATDRQIYSIALHEYQKFLPFLVKNHASAFVELFECLDYRCNIELGSTRAEYFMKNALDVLVKKPKIFLNILPFKLAYNKLSTQQFEQMFENLIEKNAKSFRNLLFYLQYYPQEKRFELLRNKVKEVCSKDILELDDILNQNPITKIIPVNLKEEYAKKRLSALTIEDENYWDEVENLPPKEAIPLLKERMNTISGPLRTEYLPKLLLSCSLYDSKEDLLEVLEYYNTRHKNEQATVLLDFLGTLQKSFQLDELEKRHWDILKDILQRAYVKGDIFAHSYIFSPAKFFKSSIKYSLKQCKTDPQDEDARAFLNTLTDMILEFYFEHDNKMDFLVDTKDFERDCLENFLAAIPRKYPETSPLWSNMKLKSNLIKYLIYKMNNINDKYYKAFGRRKKSHSNRTLDLESKTTRLSIRNYEWLVKSALDILIAGNDASSLKKNKAFKKRKNGSSAYRGRFGDCDEQEIYVNIRKLLSKHDTEFYKSLIDGNPGLLYDVISGDTSTVLKHDFEKILNSWEEYLNSCRERLQKNDRATKNFVASTKWYREIPIRFVERCLAEIEKKGSIAVLGILLEGEVLSRVIGPHLPQDSKVDYQNAEAKKKYEIVASLPVAINAANPPVALEALIPFCTSDHLPLSINCFNCVVRKVPIDRVIKFTDQLMDKCISIRKLGLRLLIMVAPSKERCEVLQHKCKTEKNTGIREVLTKMIYDLFVQSPSDGTWDLMKILIDSLTVADKAYMDNLMKVKPINKNYSAEYIQRLIQKIESFDDREFPKREKSSLIPKLIIDIDKNTLEEFPEEILTRLVKSYFSSCTNNFLMTTYLFSNKEKYQRRLDVIMESIREAFAMPYTLRPTDSMSSHYRIQLFFRELIHPLMKNADVTMNLKFIDGLLAQPWFLKEAKSYIKLHIYKIYFEEKDPMNFGAKCIDNVNSLIKVYNSSLIIYYYSEILQEFLRTDDIFKGERNHSLKLTLIEGMISKDLRLSALIGIEILNIYQIENYDSRYEDFIMEWLKSEDVMTRYVVSNFISSIDAYR